MSLYKKSGVERLAERAVEWATWVKKYGVRNGTPIFTAFLKAKKNEYLINSKVFKAPLTIRKNFSDKAIFYQVFFENQYAIDDFGANEKVSTIIDGGANIGLASIYFAGLYPDADIVAVEPESNNFALLKKNTAYYPNVTCLQAGLWHSNQPIFIQNPDAFSACFMVKAGSAYNSCLSGATIDHIMRDRKWEKIDILKLDIEGAEKDIFNGQAYKWLDHTGLLIIELHDRSRPDCTKTVFKALEPYDYMAFFHHENVFIYLNNY